ncbi:MAG TPA: insulinase family protein, partial [Puia sp.]|nr:insulinase family protein [Puia sp.]
FFYKQLVDTKLATRIEGFSLTSYDPGFTYFALNVPRDKSLDSAKSAFLAAADRLSTLTVTQEDVDRAKDALKKQVSDLQNNTLGFSIRLADIIGAGDWRLWYLYRDRVDQLTLADVQAVLHKYYHNSNLTVGVFIPDKAADRVLVPDRPDIAALVKGYKGRAVAVAAAGRTATFDATIPNIKKNTVYGQTPAGLHYALLKKPVKGDKIMANFIFKIGDEQSLSGKNSLPDLTAAMLKTGTTTRTKKDINDQLNKLKSSISIQSGAGGSSVNVRLVTDKENCMATLDLLADILLHPVFDPKEFNKLVIDQQAEIDANRSNPQVVAGVAFSQRMNPYPKGHPMYTESPDDESADLKAANVGDVKVFYSDFYGADHGYASFVGDIDRDSITAFLDRRLGSWKSRKPYARLESRYFEVPGGTQSVQIPDKKNATLYGGINVRLKESDPDYVALEIANEMLGGGAFIGSRIAKRLRENEGMSYGAGSFVQASYKNPVGLWGVYAIFNPMYRNRLDSALKDEINKALKEGFSADELQKAVGSWLSTRKTLLGLDQYLAAHQATYLEEGKDLLFDADYESKAKALTVDQVNAVLRKYVQPDKMTLVYAGTFEN